MKNIEKPENSQEILTLFFLFFALRKYLKENSKENSKVQTGELDEETYMKQMNDKIKEETTRAKKFLSEGKKEWASFALTRIKLMKAEIEASQ